MAKYEHKYFYIPQENDRTDIHQDMQDVVEMLDSASDDGWNPVYAAPKVGVYTLFRRKIKKDKGTVPPDETDPSLLMEHSSDVQPESIRQQ